MDQENQPLLGFTRANNINSSTHQRRERESYRCWTTCPKYKTILIILVWMVFVGELSAFVLALSAGLIENYVPVVDKLQLANAVSSPICFLYASLAVMAMLYPVSGFIADVCCGRFKIIMIGLTIMAISTVSMIAVLVGWVSIKHAHQLTSLDPFKEVAPFYFIGFSAVFFVVIGIAAYRANVFQFGLDQLLDAPSTSLSIFIHLAVWADILGRSLMIIGVAVGSCPTVALQFRIGFSLVPTIILLTFPFVLVFSCCKRRWFYSEAGHHNPYQNVIEVLRFVRKHAYPLNRSAFTYSDNEIPSRIDYAKERYGGPFTTEQVEDVKTFFRILALLISLGPMFVMDIPSSFVGFKTFGYHTGYKEDFIHRCTIWVIFESTSLMSFVGVVFLPLYVYRFILATKASIFSRMYGGLFVYMLGIVSMLAIDLAGHLHSVNDEGTHSHCMFTYTRNNNAAALTYPVLEMHWALLIIPNILLGIGPPILTCTVFEFISAQSPQSMKGLLVGVFFAIRGFFQLLSSISLIPFSSDRIWAQGPLSDHPPVVNCGFSYYTFVLVVALLGLVVFSVMVRRYKYRERDDRPYDQSVVEDIFIRRAQMRSPTPDYDDMDG